MSKQLRVASLSFALLYLVLSCATAGPLVRSYVEDFTTLQYCDTVNTTAWWDTLAGEVKPRLFQIMLVGSCDTPGYASGVAISGDYAYVADLASGLQVMDIGDPTDPSLAGGYDTPGSAYGLAVSGDYAYVADEASGLMIIDIGNPTSPAFAGSCDTPGSAVDVAISGDYAFVADYTSGLQVIDISDPTTPVLAGACGMLGEAWDVAISGDYAYVACDLAGLQVIDISNPTSPVLASSYYTAKFAWGVAVSGDYAYVAVYGTGLLVIDISDPTAPALAGSYSDLFTACGVAVSGDYVYVADRASGLQVVDISDPENPVFAGVFDTPGLAFGMAISGENVFVADYASGLQVVAVSCPTDPVFAGSCDTPGRARGVAISGDYAFIADYTSGLQVMDITDPTGPVFAGSYDTPGYSYAVAVSGDYAYVADYDAGLQVIDIGDPTSPALAGSCDTPGYSFDIAISGDYAYIADDYRGLQVIDISDPTNPAIAGNYDTPGLARGLALSGDYAYIADWNYPDGFQVIDISDPTDPQFRASLSISDHSTDVAVLGDYAFVTTGGSVEVIDISDPLFPTLGDYYHLFDDAHGIAISGDFAYIAIEDSGLHVVDIRNPSHLVRAGNYYTLGDAYDVEVSGDFAYVADFYSGLQAVGVFQRLFDADSSSAWSIPIDSSDDPIVSARLSSVQSDSIRWEVTNNGSSGWLHLLPDGQCQSFSAPGSNLRWRSRHVYRATQPDVNPTCTSLSIDWFYTFAVIDSIVDVGGDQGGWVRICFTRSGYDITTEPDFPVATYGIYRRIDEMALRSRVINQGERVDEGRPSEVVVEEPDASVPRVFPGATMFNLDGRYFLLGDGPLSSGLPPGTWEVLGSVPAHQEDRYIYLAPTLADSSETLMHSVYCISAETTTPSVYYFSYPDSGYSLDNLAPSAPLNLAMTSATDVAWDECPDDDFNYFTVYGSAAPSLDSTAVLVGYTIETTMDVTDDQCNYYHVTATDFAGNEGDASSVENAYAGVSVGENLPIVFALKPNRPNPFESSTMISFDLPEPCAVRLEVVDVRGRVVRVLTDEAWPAGRHSVVWSGENEAAEVAGPGVYFVRMQAGSLTASSKMLLMK